MPDFSLPSIDANAALALQQSGSALFVDMRKAPARAQSGQTLHGAVIRDPFAFSHDDPLTRTDRPLVVFCVHGHEVSQFACALLMVHGREVHYVTGGFEALAAAGADLVALEGNDGHP